MDFVKREREARGWCYGKGEDFDMRFKGDHSDRQLHPEMCENNKMLRLSVEGGGCSGFLCNSALDDKVNKDDRCFLRPSLHVNLIPGQSVVLKTLALALAYLSGGVIELLSVYLIPKKSCKLYNWFTCSG